MKKRTLAHAIQVAFLSATFGASTLHANPLALSETPLTVSTAINPNVMLLIDNSGSMEQMIWHEDFDQTQTYGDWEYRNGSGGWSDINSGNTYYPSTFRQHTCATNFVAFRPNGGGATKCLRLPAPNGANSTRYLGNYVRFLLDRFANNTDLTQGAIPDDYRMNVARDVARDLVTTTANMRFGVSRFNFQQGGSIVAECGASEATLTTQINGLTANSWTPLGETLYEITRYFRGLSSHYNSGTYTSPIQYRCQKNFTIVITDGLPTYDGSYPTNDPDDPNRFLPNWDRLNNDGAGTDSATEGDALFLDDIAKFAWDIDMRKTGNDNAGKSFQDTSFSRQNMYTYTVGFTTANTLLQDAASYGNGLYFTANNADQLKEKLKSALTDIQSKLGSSSSAATSGGSIQTGSMIYQARMNSEDWTGQLLAFAINADSSSPDYGKILKTGPGPEGSQWDAGSRISAGNWSSRTIITHRSGGGVPFRWSSFNSTEKSSYFNSTESLLEYLRGRTVSSYRSRNSLLGDIVNSAPQYVGPPSALYPTTLETASYNTFKEANKNRTPMVYVGANDGMLHAFNASTGNEALAYIPGKVLDRIKHLSESSYKENHKYYVDGTPTIADAFVGNQWRTMLVGGLNRGGQGVYALDVTNPASFSESNASTISRWEFTDANDSDLGYTYNRPAIVKLQNGTWAAVFGNGYNNTTADGAASTTGNAALFIVNLHTGALIKKISTGAGSAQDPTGTNRPNGLATVTPVDIDGDYKIDYVYAGDLFGNLWKFNLSSSNTNQWTVDYKLFEACSANTCTSSNRQAITTRPTVIRHPSSGGQLVLFGTGKYLEPSDNQNLTSGITQSFYGIWDNNASQQKPVSRRDLQVQSIIAEQAVTLGSKTQTIRVTSNNSVDWSTKSGWYMNLLSPSGYQGERQVTDSLVRNGQLIFTTMIPSANASDPCAPSGSSWIMELNAYTGARLEYTPFDMNGDRKFSSADYATISVNGTEMKVPASGQKLDGGNAQTPAVAVDPKGKGEVKYVSTSEGLEQVVENTGTGSQGRQSWRELFPR